MGVCTILKDTIIELYNEGFSFQNIANRLNITRNSVAGIIWRHKNPGMWKKDIKLNDKRRWYKGKQP